MAPRSLDGKRPEYDEGGARPKGGLEDPRREVLLNESPSNSGGEWDDFGYLSRPRPRASLCRAVFLTLCSLVIVMVTVGFLSFGKGAQFNGRMRLVSVSILHRHGARSPLDHQTWEDYTWPEGYGELTVQGMQQSYHLGQQLRDRYVDLLSLLPGDLATAKSAIKVKSPAMDLTQETSMALLMGMFDKSKEVLEPMPPVCSCRPQVGGMTNRLSTPQCLSECMGVSDPKVHSMIPEVEVLPLDKDYLFRQRQNCRGFKPSSDSGELWDKTTTTYSQALKDTQEFLKQDRICKWKDPYNPSKGKLCAGPPLGLREAQDLYNNLIAAETEGKPCPNATGLTCRSLLATLHPINEFLWNHDFENSNAIHAGGMLMGDILENMKRARKWHVAPELQPKDGSKQPPSMYLYSANDDNIASLLGTMKAPWYHAPRFASYVAFELWAPKHGDMTNEELWMVNVRYDGESLKALPGCEHGSCRFKDFFYKMFWTQSLYEEDCNWRTPYV